MPQAAPSRTARIADKAFTVVVTATITSAVWIVAGASVLDVSFGPDSPVASEAGSVSPAAADTVGTSLAASAPPAAASVGGLLIPVAGVSADQLHDSFADARGGGTRTHEAIDIMAPRGTPVLAAAAGKVERLYKSDAGGRTIYVRSSAGSTIYYYAHLDSYARRLDEGDKVERGEILGELGSTGNASPDAPHLHFAVLQTEPDAEWWEPTTAIDPYPLLTGR